MAEGVKSPYIASEDVGWGFLRDFKKIFKGLRRKPFFWLGGTGLVWSYVRSLRPHTYGYFWDFLYLLRNIGVGGYWVGVWGLANSRIFGLGSGIFVVGCW